LEDEEAASRYGTAGKKRVEDKFGLGRMIRQYEDLFERVMSTELAKSIPC
jgi:glycosyltransferase involved in cell wall biosynthesis